MTYRLNYKLFYKWDRFHATEPYDYYESTDRTFCGSNFYGIVQKETCHKWKNSFHVGMYLCLLSQFRTKRQGPCWRSVQTGEFDCIWSVADDQLSLGYSIFTPFEIISCDELVIIPYHVIM